MAAYTRGARFGQRRTLNLTASHRLYGLGAIIFVALVISSRSGVGTWSFLLGLAIAAIAYLFAIREFFQTKSYPRRVIFACLALAIMWRVPFLMMPPGPDDDIHRYVWDGRIQRLGYNPYTLIPSDPALAGLHTPDTRGLNNPEVSSPYPAGAQLFFRSVASIQESIFAFKVAFVICDFAVILLLLSVFRQSGRGEHWVLAYACHPLLALMARSGHIDLLGVLLLLVSVAALARRWRMIAAIAFGLAVAVKFLPIVLAPLYWRRVRIRDAFIAALVVVLLYVPFLEHGRIPTGSLGVYVQRFRFNGPIFATIERVVSLQFAVGLAVLAGLLTAAWLRKNPPAFWEDKWAWPMAASLAFAPVVYPWYLLWLLPFLPSTQTLPLLIWTVSILPTYIIWHMRSLGLEWHLPGWVLLLEFGSVAAAVAIVLLRRISQPAAGGAPEHVLPTNRDRVGGTTDDTA